MEETVLLQLMGVVEVELVEVVVGLGLLLQRGRGQDGFEVIQLVEELVVGFGCEQLVVGLPIKQGLLSHLSQLLL